MSICTTCENIRRVPAEQLRNEGWHGCCIFVSLDKNIPGPVDPEVVINGISCEEAATGWVDLRARWDAEKGSGMMTNMQLLVKNVTKCKYYRS